MHHIQDLAVTLVIPAGRVARHQDLGLGLFQDPQAVHDPSPDPFQNEMLHHHLWSAGGSQGKVKELLDKGQAKGCLRF